VQLFKSNYYNISSDKQIRTSITISILTTIIEAMIYKFKQNIYVQKRKGLTCQYYIEGKKTTKWKMNKKITNNNQIKFYEKKEMQKNINTKISFKA
jgi:hypothetical protein